MINSNLEREGKLVYATVTVILYFYDWDALHAMLCHYCSFGKWRERDKNNLFNSYLRNIDYK